jgi:hypothetical protein
LICRSVNRVVIESLAYQKVVRQLNGHKNAIQVWKKDRL